MGADRSRVQFEKRKSTILKGAKELSILCDIRAGVIVLSPDGKLETWPENLDDVRALFRHADESKKRHRSENPSQVKIDDDDDDEKRANKKMKAISEDCPATAGNNLQGGEEGDRTGDLHHFQLSLNKYSGNYYPEFPTFGGESGNYYPGFPTFGDESGPGFPTFGGEWNNTFAGGMGTTCENQDLLPHHQDCSCGGCLALFGGESDEFLDEFLVGDPSCSNSNNVGGGYSSSSGYEFLVGDPSCSNNGCGGYSSPSGYEFLVGDPGCCGGYSSPSGYEFLVGDPGCSSSNNGGGGHSSPSGYEFLVGDPSCSSSSSNHGGGSPLDMSF